MAINQINTAAFDYAMMLSVINLSYKTQADITITNYDNDSAPQVTAGSIFVNNGAQFENTTLATPTGYAGITNSTEFYLYYDESGGVFIYSNTAPAWSDAKQGLYNGNDKVFFSMYKDSGGTLYQNKNKYIGRYKEKPMQIETKTKTFTCGTGISTENVTGFSFNPTAVTNIALQSNALSGTSSDGGGSLFGSTYPSYYTDATKAESDTGLRVLGVSFSGSTVTVTYTSVNASPCYLTVTAVRSQ